MDTESIRWIVGAVLVVVGVPVFYIGNYLSAAEGKKKQKAGEVKYLGLIWIAAGALLYLAALIFS